MRHFSEGGAGISDLIYWIKMITLLRDRFFMLIYILMSFRYIFVVMDDVIVTLIIRGRCK